MFRSPDVLRVAGVMLFAALVPPALADGYEGIGRTATAAELRAWDIDVRPDFKGLPPGSGSVADGETLWIEKCTSCHGDFGDANHVFAPLIGNTTAADIENGRVAALRDPGRVRTTIMKVSTVATLWDFINRAMPWDRPKSLQVDEVYALVAYLLNLAYIVPADFVLSDQNIAGVQERMPNRNGMTRDHGLWDVHGKPDTNSTACMRDCKQDVMVSSSLPDFARSAHGDLAQQNREYGAIRGTHIAAPDKPAPAEAKELQVPAAALTRNGCVACHGMDAKLIGPGLRQIAQRHADRADAIEYFAGRIRSGGVGTWGDIPMPPQPQMAAEDLEAISTWLAQGAPD